MPNTILTPQIIAREALLQLSNNLVMGNLVRRDAVTEFSAAVGDTVTIRKPASFTAADMSGISASDVKEVGIPVVMAKWRGVKFGLTAKEAAMSLKEYSERTIQPAVAAIVQDVDAFLCGLLQHLPYKKLQTATTVVIGDIAGLAADMTNRKVPLQNRRLVLDPTSAAKYKVLAAILDASQRGNSTAIADAQIGRILGFDAWEDQNVLTEGTKVGDFATAATPAAVALGAESMASTASAATSGLLPAGTTFTKAGDSQIYALTEDATQVAAVGCTLKFSPPNQVAVVTPQNITVGTIASTGKTESAGFHRDCLTLVTCPLAKPVSVPSEVISENGLSIRVVYAFDQTAWSDVIALDVLYGGRVLNVELGERLIGQ
jgi:hypothetical protein